METSTLFDSIIVDDSAMARYNSELKTLINRFYRADAFESVDERIARLERQNERILTTLSDIQLTLKQIVNQNEDLTTDVFELHKRVLDLQEDSLKESLDRLSGKDSDDSIVTSVLIQTSPEDDGNEKDTNYHHHHLHHSLTNSNNNNNHHNHTSTNKSNILGRLFY